eukprot:scaffold8867_cov118-Isochrysis_galbana.AAC.13
MKVHQKNTLRLAGATCEKLSIDPPTSSCACHETCQHIVCAPPVDQLRIAQGLEPRDGYGSPAAGSTKDHYGHVCPRKQLRCLGQQLGTARRLRGSDGTRHRGDWERRCSTLRFVAHVEQDSPVCHQCSAQFRAGCDRYSGGYRRARIRWYIARHMQRLDGRMCCPLEHWESTRVRLARSCSPGSCCGRGAHLLAQASRTSRAWLQA